jgi:hypothetical protein
MPSHFKGFEECYQEESRRRKSKKMWSYPRQPVDKLKACEGGPEEPGEGEHLHHYETMQWECVDTIGTTRFRQLINVEVISRNIEETLPLSASFWDGIR